MVDGPHPFNPIGRLLGMVFAVLALVYILQITLSPAEKRAGAVCMPWYRATVFFRQDLPHVFFPNHPEWQNPFAGHRFYESCTDWVGGAVGTPGKSGQ